MTICVMTETNLVALSLAVRFADYVKSCANIPDGLVGHKLISEQQLIACRVGPW